MQRGQWVSFGHGKPLSPQPLYWPKGKLRPVRSQSLQTQALKFISIFLPTYLTDRNSKLWWKGPLIARKMWRQSLRLELCDGAYCLNTGGAFESWYRGSLSGGSHISEGEVSGHYDLKVAVGKRYPGPQPSPLIDCLKPTQLFHNTSQQHVPKLS